MKVTATTISQRGMGIPSPPEVPASIAQRQRKGAAFKLPRRGAPTQGSVPANKAGTEKARVRFIGPPASLHVGRIASSCTSVSASTSRTRVAAERLRMHWGRYLHPAVALLAKLQHGIDIQADRPMTQGMSGIPIIEGKGSYAMTMQNVTKGLVPVCVDLREVVPHAIERSNAIQCASIHQILDDVFLRPLDIHSQDNQVCGRLADEVRQPAGGYLVKFMTAF